jgi:phage-related minor tail protein
MNEDIDSIDKLDEQIEQMTDSLGEATSMAAAFNKELVVVADRMLYSTKETEKLGSSLSKGLRSAFDDVVFDGNSMADAMTTIGKRLVDTAYDIAIDPITDRIGSVLAGGLSSALGNAVMPFANGGAFSQGKVMPFAKGGVVGSPTYFPMSGGTGLMGEAGPEAIMPLTRGANGKLGVQAAGGGRATNITMNITTPDAEGFRRSQGQIAAQMSRAMGRSQRNQ